MLPSDLKPELFAAYAPEAKKLVAGYVPTLQGLPLAYVPSLLREVIEYDFKFPAERKALEKELANLSSLPPEQTKIWFQGFAQIQLSPELEKSDWVNAPAPFVENLSAHLWTTHQLDAFRVAALDYADRLRAVVHPEPPVVARLGITIIGQGAASAEEPLFRKLRPHGAYFTNVKPEGGLEILLKTIADRAKSHPIPFGHWYIDGGAAAPHDPALTCVSYGGLGPARIALSERIRSDIERPGMGPEALRTLMARLRPADLGFTAASDPVLDRFQVKLLTEGSGTQIFSTTFAQWAAREALRRAHPHTLLVRFAPRQRQKPMNEMLASGREPAELDPAGSLVDADMGAYYNWLNLQRLTGADKASAVIWFEGHHEAVAIGPSLPRGTTSDAAASLEQLLSWAA
jgi:hypothetical protein